MEVDSNGLDVKVANDQDMDNLDANVKHEVENEDENEATKNEESFRCKIMNLPSYVKHQQAKKLITSRLPGITFRKLKISPNVAYVSFQSLDDTLKAVELLNNFEFRGKLLAVRRCAAEKEFVAPTTRVVEEFKSRSANEISAPLFNIPYDEQLKMKFEDAKKIMTSLIKQLKHANIPNTRYIQVEKILHPIVRSPVLTNYRNKCEFTIADDINHEPCVGFVSGNMSKKYVVVVPVDESSVLITENMRKICAVFTGIVKESGLPVFNEFEHVGFWKRLTIRDFLGDCMLVVTVNSHEDELKVRQVQEKILSTFIKFGEMSEKYEFNVRSLFWQVQENSSDDCVYQHIGGVPYVYETLSGTRFQISPYTFFQANSRGAELLYKCIGDFLGLPKEDEQVEEDEKQLISRSKSINLLDICCGCGSIGQFSLRRIERAIQAGKFEGSYACLGVELIEQAVQDARRNAENNGFNEEKCRYVAGDAEVVFRHVDYYFKLNQQDENAEIVGVLDPPRSGLSNRVIISCRKLEKMHRLVYVSCDPKQALKNIVDLCRPESQRYIGEPFKVQKIQPVDMFPQTEHLEWVILLTR